MKKTNYCPYCGTHMVLDDDGHCQSCGAEILEKEKTDFESKPEREGGEKS